VLAQEIESCLKEAGTAGTTECHIDQRTRSVSHKGVRQAWWSAGRVFWTQPGEKLLTATQRSFVESAVANVL
jgi:hypothetical protein